MTMDGVQAGKIGGIDDGDDACQGRTCGDDIVRCDRGSTRFMDWTSRKDRRWSLARLPLWARSQVSERLEFATFYAQSPSPPIRFRRLRVNRAQLIGLEIFFRPR